MTNKSYRNSLLHKEITKEINLFLTLLDSFESKLFKKLVTGGKEKKKGKKKPMKLVSMLFMIFPSHFLGSRENLHVFSMF